MNESLSILIIILFNHLQIITKFVFWGQPLLTLNIDTAAGRGTSVMHSQD